MPASPLSANKIAKVHFASRRSKKVKFADCAANGIVLTACSFPDLVALYLPTRKINLAA